MPKTKEKKQEVVEVPNAEELAQRVHAALCDSPKWEEAAADILLNRLNIRGKSSEYDAGDFGDIVLAKEHVVIKDGEKAPVIVVSAVKAWREKTPFGSGERGRIARTEEERDMLVEENKSLGENGHPVAPFADITMLIPHQGSCEEDGFEVPIGDNLYAIGKLDVSGKGYEQTYMKLKTFEKFNPGVSLVSKTWELYTKQEQWQNKVWWVPVFKPTKDGLASEDVMEWVKNFKSA